jgi:hypothetical protein
MQRIRMSLPYFKAFNWEAEVVCVDDQFTDLVKDDLLLQSIPDDIIIHKVAAFPKKFTSKFGLGSIALRSLWFYHQKVILLLQAKNYDLIYFSTTQFPVCILGRMWKKGFGVPYVVDMQDPWHSNYYLDKPKKERPAKHWFSYRLNKYLEPIAMKNCDGLISVSPDYITTLQQRYPQLKNKPSAVIPFGAFDKDFEIAKQNLAVCSPAVHFDPKKINTLYVGRGGADMQCAIKIFFEAIKEALIKDNELFGKLHFYFIGTSYAPKELAKPTVLPIATAFGLEKIVTEITDRVGFYSTLNTLLAADALFIPGSDDPQYTPSKIYPYLLAEKPLLSIFHPESPALQIMKDYHAKYTFDFNTAIELTSNAHNFFKEVVAKDADQHYNQKATEKYAAKNMCGKQCALFDQVLNLH